MSALRTSFSYILLLDLSRWMGRKLISQMTFFDFAVAVTVGSVTANLTLGPQANTVSSSTVLITLSVLIVLFGYLHIKSFLLTELRKHNIGMVEDVFTPDWTAGGNYTFPNGMIV